MPPALQAVTIKTAQNVAVPANVATIVLPANANSIYRKVMLTELNRRSMTVWVGYDNTLTIEGGIPLHGDQKFEEMQGGINAAVYQGDIYIIHRQTGISINVFVVEGE